MRPLFITASFFFMIVAQLSACSGESPSRESNEIFLSASKTDNAADAEVKNEDTDVAAASNENAADPAPDNTGDENMGQNMGDTELTDEIAEVTRPTTTNLDLGDEAVDALLNEQLVKDCMKAKMENRLAKGLVEMKFEGNAHMDKEGGLLEFGLGAPQSACTMNMEQDPNKFSGYATWKMDGIETKIKEGVKVCGFKTYSDAGFDYKESMALTFNNKLLAWGRLDPSVLDKMDGVYMYDFQKLTGPDAVYDCVAGTAKCEVPKSAAEGKFNVDFDELMNYYFALELAKNGANYALHLLGANDPAADCRHSGVTVKMEYEYIDESVVAEEATP